MKKFDSKAYIDLLFGDQSLAAVPITMVAEYLGHTRASVDRMLKINSLEAVNVGGTKYVLLSSLKSKIDEREEQVKKVSVVIVEAATQQRVIFYDEIGASIGLSTKPQANRRIIGQALNSVAERYYRSHKVVITSIVHKKTRLKVTQPSELFFEQAIALGLTFVDRNEFVLNQMAKTFKKFKTIS